MPTLLDLATRASRAPAEATIAVVAHDSVNRVLLCEALGLPLAQYWRLRQDPCGVNVIEAGSEFRVALLNGIDHLAGVPDQAGGGAPAAGGSACQGPGRNRVLTGAAFDRYAMNWLWRWSPPLTALRANDSS